MIALLFVFISSSDVNSQPQTVIDVGTIQECQRTADSLGKENNKFIYQCKEFQI